jgi:uncharacterized protein YndB with AHSA1/START domain
MAEPQKTECTLILRRIYDAPVARLWRAWTTAEELGLWYLAGDDHIIHFAEADVRVGGEYRVAFGPPGQPPYVEVGRYDEVVPMKRLAFRATVSVEGADSAEALIHAETVVVEFIDLGDGRTQLILTDTGPESWKSAQGWLPCFESLGRYLAKERATA